jgi:hypothetical protein
MSLSDRLTAAFSRPMPLPRSGWRRRIEVFSPKLGRRLSLGSYDAFRTWLVIEANPAIDSFTERPALVGGPGSAVIERFAASDTTSVEASLFALVAGGRIESPDLAVAPLSGATRFART